jgi:thiamine transport system permease protein
MLTRWAGRGLRLAPLAFLALFFFYPLGAILQAGLAPAWQPDLSIFSQLAQDGYYRQTLWFTLWQAALSTALTLALALPAAQVFTRYRFWGQRALLALATVPFVLPTVVVAAAFEALLGRQGALNSLLLRSGLWQSPPLKVENTLFMILLAHVFYNYAIAVRMIGSFWALQNQCLQEAAMILGADGWRLFRRVTLPLLMPALLAAGSLVFIFSFTSFGVILLLGGLRYSTLEVEIYLHSTTFLDLKTAGALSVLQLLMTSTLMLFYSYWQGRLSLPLIGQSAVIGTARIRHWRARLWIGANILILGLLILAPLLALLERALWLGQDGPSLHYFAMLNDHQRESRLAVPPLEAIENSLRFAVIAMVMAVGLGLLAAYSLRGKRGRWLDALYMLPLATSAVTLGFGYLIALDEPPLNLRQSFWLIPIAHSLVAMPFVLRSILPSLNAIRPSLPEAAEVLGASSWTRWRRIEWPLIWPSVLVGAIFAFSVSMGEFGASAFIARPDQPTLPIAIARLLGLPGLANYGQALALSVILLGVCGLAFALLDFLGGKANRLS